MAIEEYSSGRNESLSSTLLRWGLNFFPAYLSTGAKVTFLSADYQEVHLEIPFNWRTRDNSGELFKGTQYAAVDPVYPMILKRKLGDDYTIKDEQANIRFMEPCRTSLRATFELTDKELERIENELTHHDSIIRIYKVDLKGEDGTVYTEIEKTLAISKADGTS